MAKNLNRTQTAVRARLVKFEQISNYNNINEKRRISFSAYPALCWCRRRDLNPHDVAITGF